MPTKNPAPDPLAEIEKTQRTLKANIAQSERLIDDAQTMLKNHRQQSAPKQRG